MKKLIKLGLTLLTLVLVLTGCTTETKDTVIKVGASITPHAEILEVIKPMILVTVK